MWYVYFYFNENSQRTGNYAYKGGPFGDRISAFNIAKNFTGPGSSYKFFDIVKE